MKLVYKILIISAVSIATFVGCKSLTNYNESELQQEIARWVIEDGITLGIHEVVKKNPDTKEAFLAAAAQLRNLADDGVIDVAEFSFSAIKDDLHRQLVEKWVNRGVRLYNGWKSENPGLDSERYKLAIITIANGIEQGVSNGESGN